MQIQVEVVNPKGDQELSLSHLGFVHSGCGPIKQLRDPATDECTLQCDCGLFIRFPSHGKASATVIVATLEGLPQDLPEGSYSSSPTTSVRIVPRAAD